jgi:hypothetical protein
MTRSIGGALDLQALARLHFTTLTQDEQQAEIRRECLRWAEGRAAWSVNHCLATTLSVRAR